MTLSELIASYREESGDKVKKYFASDELLIIYANQAEKEACRRAKLIRASADDMCSISASAGESLIALDNKIIELHRVNSDLSPHLLCPATVEFMDASCPGWEQSTGNPTCYITDYQAGNIRLYPTPATEMTVSLTVSRLPLNNMESANDEPEIPEHCHLGLVQWMLYRGYAKHDADSFNAAKSERALKEFEKEFGAKSSIRNEEWQRQRPENDTYPVA